jgi:capsular exopolysaccharide synthesis family protein
MTLRDYLSVLRRHWIMIAVVALVGAAAGFATVARQKSVYQASAEVSFQDPTQALNVVGLSGSNGNQTPAQLAAVNAETTTGNAVMSQVKRQLKAPESVNALTHALTTQVSTQSGLLQITATGSSPGFATRLANAAAGVLVAQDNQRTRTQFAQVARDMRSRISNLPAFQRTASPASPLTFYENELARVDTLGQFATSAQLAKLAQPPSGPSSPQRSRSVALGLALGLLLGIVVAFFRDSLDRRLRSPQDIDSSFRLPLLGYVGKQNMGRMAYTASGSGGRRQLDLEQFKILRRNLEILDHERPPRSILVTSTVPGEGKTTVASSLALAMAAAGKRTLLVDCDLRRPALASRLGVQPAPGISEYLAGHASPEEILRTFEFSEPARVDQAAGSTNGHGTATLHKLVCIPAGTSSPRAADLLGSNRFKEFIEQVHDAYDAVVLDSSPLLPVADTLEMLPHVDAIVICARESRTTRGQASAARATLSRFPARPTGVVVTDVRPHGAGDEIFAYSYGYS